MMRMRIMKHHKSHHWHLRGPSGPDKVWVRERSTSSETSLMMKTSILSKRRKGERETQNERSRAKREDSLLSRISSLIKRQNVQVPDQYWMGLASSILLSHGRLSLKLISIKLKDKIRKQPKLHFHHSLAKARQQNLKRLHL
jgi:hypothetical protein